MEELHALLGATGQQPQLATAQPIAGGGLVTRGQDVTEGVPLVAPAGICCAPAEGEQLLLLPYGDYYVCVGALVDCDGIAPGELKLKSAGGAVVHLKNNGDICINSLTVTKGGQLVNRGED